MFITSTLTPPTDRRLDRGLRTLREGGRLLLVGVGRLFVPAW